MKIMNHEAAYIDEMEGTVAGFDMVGYHSDSQFYAIEAFMDKEGGCGIIPQGNNLSSVWYNAEEWSLEDLTRRIDEVLTQTAPDSIL